MVCPESRGRFCIPCNGLPRSSGRFCNPCRSPNRIRFVSLHTLHFHALISGRVLQPLQRSAGDQICTDIVAGTVLPDARQVAVTQDPSRRVTDDDHVNLSHKIVNYQLSIIHCQLSIVHCPCRHGRVPGSIPAPSYTYRKGSARRTQSRARSSYAEPQPSLAVATYLQRQSYYIGELRFPILSHSFRNFPILSCSNPLRQCRNSWLAIPQPWVTVSGAVACRWPIVHPSGD